MALVQSRTHKSLVDLNPKQLRSDLHLSREKMGRLLNVSAKTIERWENTDAMASDLAKRTLLLKIRELRDLGLSVYSPAGFDLFLTTPLRAFGDRTALQEIEAGNIDRVIGELAADYEGLGY